MRLSSSRQNYDLEPRCLLFAKSVKELIDKLPKSMANDEYSRQLLRSSASIGANYIEANEALGRKDFFMRLKICKKESKETRYWLQLVTLSPPLETTQKQLLQESTELMKIFHSIIQKSTNSNFDI